MESIRLGGTTHGIATKTVHKTVPGGGGGLGGGWVEVMGSREWWGVQGWKGSRGGWVRW